MERFVLDEDESQQEEFRQLLKSFQRFYAFVAQVVSLNDAWLEKLYAYTSWLSRLLPSRDVPADITITDDMLELSAFKLQKGEEGSASLSAGETAELQPITEFGANAYTEEEEKSLSEIIDSFNERHSTLVDEREAASILCYSVRALQNWRHRGGGPKFVKVSSRSVRYRRTDLMAWIEERIVSNTSQTI